MGRATIADLKYVVIGGTLCAFPSLQDSKTKDEGASRFDDITLLVIRIAIDKWHKTIL